MLSCEVLHFPSAPLIFLRQVLVMLKVFASCLGERRLLTPAPVTYSPLHKDQNHQQTNRQQSPKKLQKLQGMWENIKREKMYLCRRLTEVEDELEGEKIGLLLTAHKAAGLGQACEEVLLSSQWILQPRGGRLQRVGDITCPTSITATWAQPVESQDVSFRGTIDPTASVGGKPGRSNHIRPSLKGATCQELFWIIHDITKHADAKRKNTLLSQYKSILVSAMFICRSCHVAAFQCRFLLSELCTSEFPTEAPWNNKITNGNRKQLKLSLKQKDARLQTISDSVSLKKANQSSSNLQNIQGTKIENGKKQKLWS